MSEKEQTNGLTKGSNLPAAIPPTHLVLRRTEGALGLLRDVVQESSAEYWYERGKVASAAADWAQAVYAFGRCVKLDGSHQRGGMQLAMALFHMEKLFESAKALEQSCNGLDDPYELEEEQWGDLEAAFAYDIVHGNSQSEMSLPLALVYSFTEKWAEARQVLDSIRFVSSEFSALWNKLSGAVYFARYCDYEAALSNFDRAILLEPDYPMTYWFRGNVKRELEDYSGARDDYSRVIEFEPNDADAHYARGCVRKNLGDYAGALDDFHSAIVFGRYKFEAYKERAFLRYELGDYSGAALDFEWLTARKADGGYWYFRRGMCYENIGDFLGARRDYDLAIKLSPKLSEDFYQRASLREQMRDFEGAEEDRKLGDFCREQPWIKNPLH